LTGQAEEILQQARAIRKILGHLEAFRLV